MGTTKDKKQAKKTAKPSKAKAAAKVVIQWAPMGKGPGADGYSVVLPKGPVVGKRRVVLNLGSVHGQPTLRVPGDSCVGATVRHLHPAAMRALGVFLLAAADRLE